MFSVQLHRRSWRSSSNAMGSIIGNILLVFVFSSIKIAHGGKNEVRNSSNLLGSNWLAIGIKYFPRISLLSISGLVAQYSWVKAPTLAFIATTLVIPS